MSKHRETWEIPRDNPSIIMDEIVLDHVVQYSVRLGTGGDAYVRVATAAGEIVTFSAEHLESFQDALYGRT